MGDVDEMAKRARSRAAKTIEPNKKKASHSGDKNAGRSDPGLQAPPWEPLKTDDELPPLPFANLAAWNEKPVPERQWVVRDRIPAATVTLLSGDGGIGKTILALQLAVGVALDRDWIGAMPQTGAVIGIFCEDDEAELHRRLAPIVSHHGASFADLSKMHMLSLAGEDALMATLARSGLMVPTKLFERLREAACDIKPALIVLDTSADVYGGNENDRAQVRQFVGLLRGLAMASGAGVLLTSHPSLTGINSGTGLSGSTAWNASVRSRLYFTRATTDRDEESDPDARVLEVMKANYGPVGESVVLRWSAGLFLTVAGMGGTLNKLAGEQYTDETFLNLLAQFASQGRNLNHSPTAPNYAPAMLAKEPGAKGIRKAAFADAMRRLFAASRIHVSHYGRPSRPYSKLVAGPAPSQEKDKV
jgi:RecA-family ATPase